MKRKAAILQRLGIPLSKDARILDFGCGAGRTVYALLDQGYHNTVGYDVKDYLELRDPGDRSRFLIAAHPGAPLPFQDESFDLIISEQVLEHVMDQVGMLHELHRIMRWEGIGLHVFPARYCPIEPHIYVPLGGVFGHLWWYRLWASLGVRNEFQRGLSAEETANRNAYYFVQGLNYVQNACYEVVWEKLGYDWKWLDQENFDTSERLLIRWLGKVNARLPIFGWLNRTFHTRRVFLRKSRRIAPIPPRRT